MSRPLTHLKKTRGDQALCGLPSKRFSEIPTCGICRALIRRIWEREWDRLKEEVPPKEGTNEARLDLD